MIKHIVHIDRNYPRKFNGVDVEDESLDSKYNKPNWSFDTVAATDDIEGEIDTESQYSISQSGYDVSNPDKFFDANYATEQQSNALQQDKQIRFNANVFNYVVHTSIDNIILKYEAPVVYSEGYEDKDTGEFDWKQTYTVLAGYNYPIYFSILMHDPMGIDSGSYEAYVRNTLFGRANRKTDNTTVQADVKYATFVSPTEAISGSGTLPTKGKYITLYYKNYFSFEKMHNKYNKSDVQEPEFAYKININLGGTGYDSTYVNSTDAELEHWNSVINSETSTEAEIVEAWENCSGVKFKFFDIAGNVTYWVMPYIEIVIVTLKEVYNLKRLILEFVNTRPADLFLGDDLIGRTTIKVTNPNHRFVENNILISLDENSLGELYPDSRQQSYITTGGGRKIAKIVTEDVGNIDDSGWVIAHAELDIEDFDNEDLQFVRTMVRNLTRVDGSLGEWIKECNDNTRKINLDPFVPQYLKETTDKNSAYYRFVKFTERYLNTMFKAYDKNCYISILEAIARIGNFNDYSLIYKNLLDKYDNDHGDMLHITADELALLIDTEKQELTDDET